MKPLTPKEQVIALEALMPSAAFDQLTLELLSEQDAADDRHRLLEQARTDRVLLEQLSQYATGVATTPRQRRPVDADKLLLTQTEAARLLGCDRRTTLARLIADRVLQTVPGARGPRVRRADVLRLVQEGVVATSGSRRRRSCRSKRTLPPPDVLAAEIAAIKID